MRKIILPLLCITLITSCEKHEIEEIEKDVEQTDSIPNGTPNDTIVIGPDDVIIEVGW